jgi:hypothetical protein
MGMSGHDVERRSRELYDESVDGVDMRTRSRLTQARHAALAAADGVAARPRWMSLAPAYGAAAALVLGVALWVNHANSDKFTAMADGRNGIEDLELVVSNDQLEFLQDDPEFYEWADKSDAAGAAPPGGTTG